jgi:hypothetical protein
MVHNAIQHFSKSVTYLYLYMTVVRRDSSVGIAMCYGLYGRGSIPGRDTHSVQNDSGAYLASCPMGTGGYFPEHEAENSPASSAKVNIGGAIPLLPHTYSWRCA